VALFLSFLILSSSSCAEAPKPMGARLSNLRMSGPFHHSKKPTNGRFHFFEFLEMFGMSIHIVSGVSWKRRGHSPVFFLSIKSHESFQSLKFNPVPISLPENDWQRLQSLDELA
jgi:hypothetical protein